VAIISSEYLTKVDPLPFRLQIVISTPARNAIFFPKKNRKRHLKRQVALEVGALEVGLILY
jgi:hypothetical protein